MNIYLQTILDVMNRTKEARQSELDLLERQKLELKHFRANNKVLAESRASILRKLHDQFKFESRFRIFVENEESFGFNLDVIVLVANQNLFSRLNNVPQNADNSPELYGDLLEQYQYGLDYVFAPDSVEFAGHLLELGGGGLVEAFYKAM